MTLQECYAAMGGQYEEVVNRLLHESMVKKFLLRFPQDENFSLLLQAVEEAHWQEAFRAVHTLKGVCATLGMTDLWESSSALTEALRGGKPLTDQGLLSQVEADYQAAIEAITAYQNS